ncbi:hypothetical protein NEOLEDRAFT_1239812 [Neolentinus lepideus HHB14362 ss-1]|uniref:ABM domain-containing protein n=1 Tax=Neolentinus lepideus HHB14362 ss-1 TaxID=1314782 RepID=A0A165UF53_9AGAM|nr:hypothetical protein NEOLEDRAFT_1239812 [Neolentinus lepideus HHB14362 ss-1]
MSLPVIELVTFTSSEAYQKDQGVLKGLIEILDATDGKISTYHGPQIEDASQGYFFVLWQSYEHHVALMNAPVYAKLIETLKPAVGGPFEMIHVRFTKNPTPVLEAPVTEVAFITLKPGKTKEQVAPLLDQLTSRGLSAWGPTIEKEDTLVLTFGWASVEEHTEVISNAPEEAKQVLASIKELADIKLAHGKVKKY